MVEIGSENALFGRRRIYASSDVITAENVVAEVNNALLPHMANMKDEEYLYWYRRGKQPILERVKEIRPEINSKITENDADEIVTFKDGYFLTKPASYISLKEDTGVTDKVKELNEYVRLSGKYEADNDLVDWFHTVGLGVLFVEPNDDSEIPFNVYSLDPRSSFVVYSMRPGNKPVMGINIVVQNKALVIDVFTKSQKFTLKGRPLNDTELTYGYSPDVTALELIGEPEANVIGEIPIVEYAYNKLRMGAFENVLSLLDSINEIQSNREDGIRQFIQSLMILYNCELDEGTTANSIRKDGYIQLKNTGENKADVKILSEQLDQSQTQVTLNDLREQVFKIAGVPFTKDIGGSTSDTGSAVYLRNGWTTADTHARNTEDEYKKANAYFDAVILAILKKRNGFSLKRSDFEVKIVRNDVSNLLVKTQAAMNMKELGFAPALAFERSGLSSDPLTDVEVSKEYIDKAWNTEKEEPVIPQTNNGAVQNALEPQDRVKGGEPSAVKVGRTEQSKEQSNAT